ncbi:MULTISPECIES: phage tail protein [unclassified Pseudomonas]|uniref:phage tail protein n=1 Tax=unclassified Pseudomonas TaxID=196821 RepID=UPI0037FCA43D
MVDQTSQFYAILTNVGAAKQANADALGIAWKITQMGIGDANGTDPTPNATQASLINEWRRAPLNQLKVDDKNSAIIVAEQVIPADVGGKWIREIALYDADGDMVAVANCAPTYKPLLSQGSGRTQVVRMNLVVSSASNVQLKIDPAVVLATREWVTEELARQDFKHSVVAATTANIALSGLPTIDGVALTAGARVLVKNQTAAKDNGIYQAAVGAWSRSSDADTDAKVTPGLLVLVEKGTVNGDSAWQLVTDGPITLGVSAQAYEMAFGRSGVAAATYRSVTVDKYGRVTAATNPTTVAGYGLTDVYTKAQVDSALALKAPLASPALSGIPTAPTANAGTNTTQLANTAFVMTAVANLVASAPGALDTLNELAAALGNDPNFATTVTNQLANKAALASPTFTGDPKAPTAAATDSDTSIATTAFVRSAMALFGLGAPSAAVANIDELAANGFYVVGEGTAGTKPKHPVTGQVLASGQVLHIHRPSTVAATQLWDTLTSGEPFTFIRSRVGNTTQWTAWAQLWSSGNTPKQASPTDITEGAMAVVGSFGLGKGYLSTETDLNQYVVPGNYLTPMAGLTNVPRGWLVAARYNLVVEGFGAYNYLVQRITGGLSVGATPIQAIRVMQNANGWTDWQIVNTSLNLPFRGLMQFKTAGVYQWVVPDGVHKVDVEVRGGGGSGAFGARDSTVIGPGGGGGGGISKRLCSVTPGSVITVTVGAGGTAVAGEGESGVAGGSSSFGAFCSATGGTGGGMNVGVSGGRGSGGDFNASLGSGFPPVRSSGGSTNWGGQGGGGESIYAASDTSALTQPGMGGGGRTVTRSQAGAVGCVFITY